MRINIRFELEKKTVPNDFRALILSFIKYALERTSPESYGQMYGKNNTAMKSFTFSVYFPNANINKDSIAIFENYINASFSILDSKEFIVLYNAFNYMRGKNYPMDNNSMTLKNIVMGNEKIIQENRVIIKFLSPLVVRSHDKDTNKDAYLDFQNEGFSDSLNKSVENMAKKFSFENIYDTKIALMPYEKDGVIFAKRTAVPFKDMFLNASYGKFILEGDNVLLNYLYKTGIGGRRSEGFGMFELV